MIKYFTNNQIKQVLLNDKVMTRKLPLFMIRISMVDNHFIIFLEWNNKSFRFKDLTKIIDLTKINYFIAQMLRR